jgi:preprotein translocase subunit SecA
VQLSFTNGLDQNSLTTEKLHKAIRQAPMDLYEQRKNVMGKEIFERLQKDLLLMAIDIRWKEHLLNMDHLKEGINLRAYGQKDPLVEYKKEAFNLYSEMDYSIKTETVERLMKIQIANEEQLQTMNAPEAPRTQRMTFSHGDDGEAPKPAKREEQKVGRNDPCPCGSGKKYKKCHGTNE